MKFLDKAKKVVAQTGRTLHKNAPTILTVSGVAGLGYAGYLGYKARPRVEEVVEDIEEQREDGIEPNKVEVGRDLASALALPISVGVFSGGLILTAHNIQKKRIGALASTVAASAAENLYYRTKYKDKYGQEEYDEFYTPMSEQEVTYEDENGKEKTKKAKVKDDIGSGLNGKWFDESDEYTSDDHVYNKQFVKSKIEALELIYFQRGFLLMNEVLQEFGFPTTRKGGILGWSQSNISPDFDIVQSNVFNEETGFEEKQIFVRWNQPTSEYDAFDYSEGLDRWR